MTRKERLAKRNAFLGEQKKITDWLKESGKEAGVEYAVAQKVDGRWRWAFRTPHEPCRDSLFAILETDKRFPVRRVNL
tara:strand:- start:11260 stop:11493 length:234 start_codon:yes stop_codon:yes gene_type:complete